MGIVDAFQWRKLHAIELEFDLFVLVSGHGDNGNANVMHFILSRLWTVSFLQVRLIMLPMYLTLAVPIQQTPLLVS